MDLQERNTIVNSVHQVLLLCGAWQLANSLNAISLIGNTYLQNMDFLFQMLTYEAISKPSKLKNFKCTKKLERFKLTTKRWPLTSPKDDEKMDIDLQFPH